jgi:hypothetical protein
MPAASDRHELYCEKISADNAGSPRLPALSHFGTQLQPQLAAILAPNWGQLACSILANREELLTPRFPYFWHAARMLLPADNLL